MVSQKIAYIDEFGAFGFKFENPGCSTHFILTAIIVDPSDVETVKNGVVEIRKKYFQSVPEIKSKYVGRDYKRRLKILAEMRKLPFKIFALVYDKRKIFKSSGLRYKKSFSKFINRLAYHELSVCFPKIEIVADGTGYNDFMKSFAKCMREQVTPTSLFKYKTINLGWIIGPIWRTRFLESNNYPIRMIILTRKRSSLRKSTQNVIG